MNGFCPIGPSIVTPDEMADPHNLNLKCIVNGVTKQGSFQLLDLIITELKSHMTC